MSPPFWRPLYFPFWSTAIAFGRPPRPQPSKDSGKRLRINDRIRISPVRLIGPEEENLGLQELGEALRRAQAFGLDLVEVAPEVRPPVCRIMDYGKWKYEQQKKDQRAKSHTKKSELKEVRLRPVIDKHDFDIKLKHAREFLLEGHKVQFVMPFKGREITHKEIGHRTMNEALKLLADISKVEGTPQFMGKRYILILMPDKHHAQGAKSVPSAATAALAPSKPAAPAPAPAPSQAIALGTGISPAKK